MRHAVNRTSRACFAVTLLATMLWPAAAAGETSPSLAARVEASPADRGDPLPAWSVPPTTSAPLPPPADPEPSAPPGPLPPPADPEPSAPPGPLPPPADPEPSAPVLLLAWPPVLLPAWPVPPTTSAPAPTPAPAPDPASPAGTLQAKADTSPLPAWRLAPAPAAADRLTHAEMAVAAAPRIASHTDSERLKFAAELIVWAFEPSEWGTAVCVMSYESRAKTDVLYREADGYLSVGLFQVNEGNLSGKNRIRGLQDWSARFNGGRDFTGQQARELLLQPGWNVLAAAEIHKAEGWLPAWTAQKRRCGLSD